MTDFFSHNPALEVQFQKLAEIAGYLWEKGWAERNAGNISVNLTGLFRETGIHRQEENTVFKLHEPFNELAGQYFMITCTGSRMRDLAASPGKNTVIIRIAGDGASYTIFPTGTACTRNQHPSSELSTHLGIHQLIARRGSKEKVIIHTHATELIALTQNPEFRSSETLNKLLWGMHPETLVFIPKGIGFVPYALPGSEEIARLTIQALKHHDAVVWEKHGVFSIGENIADTFDNIDILCKSAKIYFMCRGAGFVPEGLSAPQLDDLKELVKKFSSG